MVPLGCGSCIEILPGMEVRNTDGKTFVGHEIVVDTAGDFGMLQAW
jgi:hypothetical protein